MIIGIDASNILSGGGVTHLVELLNASNLHEFEISKIVVWGGKKTLAKISDNNYIEKVNLPMLNKSLPFRIFWQIFLLTKVARKKGCNIIFVPGGSFTTSFRPVVTMSQNLLPFESKELFRFGLSFKAIKLLLLRCIQSNSFKKATGIIFLTTYAKKAVCTITGKLSGQTSIIPHGIDERFFLTPKPQKPIEQYSEKNPFRLLYVSIVDMYKHQWHVVEAVEQLRRQGFPVCLDLIGPAYPPALNRLKKVLNKYDAESSYLNYIGPVSYKELYKYYAAADIFIFASSCENMPNILLEAMASGLPIACSKLGPMPEILGDAGVYFDPESAESMASSLIKLIESPQLRYENSNQSFTKAKHYSWLQCADETYSFLSKITKLN